MTEQELLSQPEDAYMDAAQQRFFRELLLAQRNELQQRIAEEFEAIRDFEPTSDPSDIGTAEEHRQWQLRLLEREKKLLDKIDAGLDRVARGELKRSRSGNFYVQECHTIPAHHQGIARSTLCGSLARCVRKKNSMGDTALPCTYFD